MNLPNKLTMLRILLAAFIVVLLLFPFGTIGISFPIYTINGVFIQSEYILAGLLFIAASLTDFIDGYLARKLNLVGDFGKMMDAIADKILVNSVLIILAGEGFISPLIPVIIISRDTAIDAIKMLSGSKGIVVAASRLGKLKTIFMMVGVTLMLFYNLPFEFLNLKIADFLIWIATLLSVVSAVQYYNNAKGIVFNKAEM